MLIELAPSILSADFARLGDQAQSAIDGGGTVLHVDIMDGHFVPNITIGPPVVASLRKAVPDVPFDCHLMIENPDEFIPAFAEAGATLDVRAPGSVRAPRSHSASDCVARMQTRRWSSIPRRRCTRSTKCWTSCITCW